MKRIITATVLAALAVSGCAALSDSSRGPSNPYSCGGGGSRIYCAP